MPAPMKPATIKKYELMADLYRSGKTIQQVAEELGCAKSTVSIGIRKFSYPDQDSASVAKWGCSHEQYAFLRKHPDRPTKAFQDHKSSASRRGIAFELTLWQWWNIWQDSGNWSKRGRRGDQYVMCRNRDIGPYAVGNVYIASGSQNKEDAAKFRSAGRNPCTRCGVQTSADEDAFGEFICDDCEQNAAEAAWERFCGDFYGGADPLTVREKQIHDWKNRP